MEFSGFVVGGLVAARNATVQCAHVGADHRIVSLTRPRSRSGFTPRFASSLDLGSRVFSKNHGRSNEGPALVPAADDAEVVPPSTATAVEIALAGLEKFREFHLRNVELYLERGHQLGHVNQTLLVGLMLELFGHVADGHCA